MDPDERKRKRREYSAAWYQSNKRAAQLLDDALAGASTTQELNTTVMTPEDIENIEATENFVPVAKSTKRLIFDEASAKIGFDSLQKKTCAICDCDWPSKSMKRVKPTKAALKKWKIKLAAHGDLPQNLIFHYDVSSLNPDLGGMLLSRQGIEIDTAGNPTAYLSLCASCHTSMKSNTVKTPKFAIANGFAIGRLPEHLQKLTLPEKRITSMTSLSMYMSVMRGGKHKVLKGNSYIVTMEPSVIALRLPEFIPEGAPVFRIVFAGTLTSSQEIEALKRYSCRTDIVKGILEFYIQNNDIYKAAGVQVAGEELEKLQDTGSHNSVEIVRRPSEEDASRVDQESTSVRHPEHFGEARTEEDEKEYKETTSVFVDQSPITSLQALSIAKDTVLLKNKGVLLSDYDRDLLAMAFPELFPYGHGHPGDDRQVRVSLEECCRYYLRLASHAFAKSPTFISVIFNLISRRKVALSTVIRAKVQPDKFAELGEVSRDEIALALSKQKAIREDALAGRAIQTTNKPRFAVESSRAESLLRSVHVSYAHMWGSAGERGVLRRRAFSMDAFLKCAALFVTITPSDVATLAISVLSGGVTAEQARCLSLDEITSHSQRVSIAGCNPLACAEYFEIVAEAFFESMVRVDKTTGRSLAGGGIFGTAKGYYGVGEPQESGTLHMHCVIYIAGLPRTIADFVKSCQHPNSGEQFKDRFRRFVDSVVTTSLLICPEISDELPCPKCDAVNTVTPIPISEVDERAFQEHKQHDRPTPTSKCNSCGCGFGSTEILRHQVSRMQNAYERDSDSPFPIPLAEIDRISDEITEKYCSLIQKMEWPTEQIEDLKDRLKDLQHRLEVCRIALLTQSHNYRHVKSCFKQSSMGHRGKCTCRHSMPRESGHETTVEHDGTLIVGRKHFNEYITTFNDAMLKVLRSKHDIRFLVGAGTTDAIYYCLKYLTKVQMAIESLEGLLLMSYDRRQHKELQGTPLTPVARGRARVNSMALSLCGKQEVPVTICALYLRRGNIVFSSHDFAPLLLAQAIAIIENTEHDVTMFQNSDGKFVKANQYCDFLYRHSSLRCLGFMRYVSLMSVSKKAKWKLETMGEEERQGVPFADRQFFPLADDHPLSNTHLTQKRPTQVIPDIIGPRIPDRNRLDSKDERERYALIALVLFFPFHSEDILMAADDGNWEKLQLFLEHADQFTLQTLENFQEYYESKQNAAKERLATQQAQLLGNPSFPGQSFDEPKDGIDDFTIDDLVLHATPFEALSAGVRKTYNRTIQSQLTSQESNMCTFAFSASFIRTNADNHYSWLRHTADEDLQRSLSDELTARRERVISRRRRSNDIQNSALQNTEKERPESRAVDTQTTLELLRHALCNTEKTNTRNDTAVAPGIQEVVPNCPTIANVSTHFGLNDLQHTAFRMIATAFLQKIAKAYEQSATANTSAEHPFTMFLGGEGGTGKTRVIQALLFFAEKWNVPGSIRTCAPTGIAASLVRGQTFHSLIGLRGGSTFSVSKHPSERSKQDLQNLLVLILDEVSMLSRKNLGALSVYLQKAKEDHSRNFGGVIVVFSDDFFQIPPVNAAPVYQKHVPDSKNTPTSLDVIGSHLWHSITNVIILTQSMRHNSDPEFSACLKRVRQGQYTATDLTLLNARVLKPDLSNELKSCMGSASRMPIVVSGNEIRHGLNWRFVGELSRKLGMKPVVSVARMKPSNQNLFSQRDLENLFQVPDNKTSNMATLLPMLPGMPIRLTQNLAVELCLSNGSEGTLLAVDFPSTTIYQEANLFGVRCKIADQLPIVAYIECPIAETVIESPFSALPVHLPSNVIPIVPFTTQKFSAQMRGTSALSCGNSMSLCQLPFVPAFAATTYKVQGTTVDGIIPFPFIKGSPTPPPFAALYVPLSRVRSFKNLFLCEEITEEHVKKFRPPQQLLDEYVRLEMLHDSTIQREA